MIRMNRLVASVVAISLFLPTTIHAASLQEPNKEFDAFLHDEYVEMMESDYATLHFSLRDYEGEGITKPEVSLGVPSLEEREEDLKTIEDTMHKMKEFDYGSLTPLQQHDYDAYMFDLESDYHFLTNHDLSMYFAPGSSVTDNLLTNFTEFVFYEKVDIEDYLTLLKSTPDFMDGALDITKQQASNGFFLNDRQLDATIDSIHEFTGKKDGNPLIVIFNENVDAFDGLSDEERNAYKEENHKIVFDEFIPSYEHVANELEALRGSRKYEGGYCNYEDGGQAYYRNLIRQKSSSTKTIETQVNEQTEFLMALIQQLFDVYEKTPNADELFMDEFVGMDEPTDVLAYLQDHMEEYPKGPHVEYKVSYLDQSVANDSVVAYYMQPPVDDLVDNVIRINGANISDENGLYETLAHEGFPGHLYQITWYYNTNPNRLRTVLNNIGYSEGWAMFTEIRSWDYAPKLSDSTKEFHKIYDALNYVEQSCIDMGVNGLGWNVNDIKEWMDHIGLNDDYAESLYEFAVDYPGQLVPYGSGLMHFFMLQSNAKQALGDDFNETEFLNVLLTNGDRNFDLVEKDVNEWIDLKGGTVDQAPLEDYVTESKEKSFFETKNGIYTTMGVLVGISIIALIWRRRSRKEDPFDR